MPKTEEDWEVEEAARTLIRAEEIKMDKKLYKKAVAKIKEQRKAADNALG